MVTGMVRVVMPGGVELEGEWELFVLSADALRVGFGRCGLSVDITGEFVLVPDDRNTLKFSVALRFASFGIEEKGIWPGSFWLEDMPLVTVLSELWDDCSFRGPLSENVAEVPGSFWASRGEFDCRPGLVF